MIDLITWAFLFFAVLDFVLYLYFLFVEKDFEKENTRDLKAILKELQRIRHNLEKDK